MCTWLLAGFGAHVLHAEPPGRGARLRGSGPFPDGVSHRESSGAHAHLGAGKRSATLDVASASGAALLRRMLHDADALVLDGNRTHHHSLAPAALEAAFPSLLVVSITPQGAGGPRADWRGGDLVQMALSGYLSLNGDPDREPLRVWGDQSERQAGMHAALALMALLRERDASGSGQTADVSATEAAGMLLSGALQREAVMRRPQRRNGPRPASFGANRLYPSTIRPCADGHVHVHCHNRFHDLVSVLMEEPALNTPDVQREPLGHADEIDALMDGWLATRTRAEAVRAAQDLRVPMTEVLAPREVLDDGYGHFGARNSFRHARVGTQGVRLPDAPARLPDSPWVPGDAPALGEATAAVMQRIGVDAQALARLAAAGVI